MMSLTKPLKILFVSLLEIIRVITIFIVLGYLSGVLLEEIYLSFRTEYQYLLYGYMAIPILFFVLYRNKWQFSGWHKGNAQKKLPKIGSIILLTGASILLVLPPILSRLMD